MSASFVYLLKQKSALMAGFWYSSKSVSRILFYPPKADRHSHLSSPSITLGVKRVTFNPPKFSIVKFERTLLLRSSRI